MPLISNAADLRAGGASWNTVAEKVGRHHETCRHWPRRFPETWRRLFRDAESMMIADSGVEARNVLRTALRSKDAKVSLTAAQMLLRSRDAQRAREEEAERPAPERVAVEITEFARYLKGLSDAQLAGHVEDFLARRAADGASTPQRPPESE